MDMTRNEIKRLADDVLDGLGLPKGEEADVEWREKLMVGAKEWRRRKDEEARRRAGDST